VTPESEGLAKASPAAGPMTRTPAAARWQCTNALRSDLAIVEKRVNELSYLGIQEDELQDSYLLIAHWVTLIDIRAAKKFDLLRTVHHSQFVSEDSHPFKFPYLIQT
jgi:hypothetical protein